MIEVSPHSENKKGSLFVFLYGKWDILKIKKLVITDTIDNSNKIKKARNIIRLLEF